MANYKDSENFVKDVLDFSSLLDDAIDWIKSNMDINEVFDEDDIVDWVSNNKNPEEVYSNSDLSEWASDNYDKEEK